MADMASRGLPVKVIEKPKRERIQRGFSEQHGNPCEQGVLRRRRSHAASKTNCERSDVHHWIIQVKLNPNYNKWTLVVIIDG